MLQTYDSACTSAETLGKRSDDLEERAKTAEKLLEKAKSDQLKAEKERDSLRGKNAELLVKVRNAEAEKEDYGIEQNNLGFERAEKYYEGQVADLERDAYADGAKAGWLAALKHAAVHFQLSPAETDLLVCEPPAELLVMPVAAEDGSAEGNLGPSEGAEATETPASAEAEAQATEGSNPGDGQPVEDPSSSIPKA